MVFSYDNTGGWLIDITMPLKRSKIYDHHDSLLFIWVTQIGIES